MIRYMDNAFKILAEETAWPNFYRKLLWACVGIAVAAGITLAFGPHYLMK
jgi:hypothetical protein